MRIGYIVSAYKLPHQLVRLVRRLAGGDVAFAIHVDAKTPHRDHDAMVSGVRDLDDVRFLPRHACHWGGFGHVEATLKGLDHLLGATRPPDYVVLLTGQDYPLAAPASIRARLGDAAGASFLHHLRLPFPPWDGHGGLDRIRSWHLTRHRRLHLRIPARRRIPGGLSAWGGGPYWCLSVDAASYVRDYVDAHPEYVRFFRHAYVPDELFFQTILLNSPLRGRIVDDDLRYIDWTRRPAPAILTVDDFERLVGSDKLFARKFDTSIDSEILDLLDAHIDGGTGEAGG